MRVTCERCLRRYDVPDATVKGRKIRARCKCGARVVVQDEERAAKSLAAGSHTTGSIQRPVRWFVDITSWEPIAMDLRQLVRAFDAGRIDADTLVWRKGMPDWRRLRDVTELAERLIGGEETAKSASEPPAAELSASGSEPPPRQSERSRTPPASYTVAGHSGSEPPAPMNTLGSRSSSPPVAAEDRSSSALMADGDGSVPANRSATPRSPANGAAANGAALNGVAANGAAEPRSAPRPHSRKGRGKTPSRPNASPVALSRTTTQTGLESPADVAARHSLIPPAPSNETPEAERTSTSPNAGGSSATRTRDARTSASVAGGRRPRSSDETPAQKPSSLSVPPGALAGTSPRPRSLRFLAMAAVVLGGVILVKQLVTTGDGAASTARNRVDAIIDPKQAEKSLAPEPSAMGAQPAGDVLPAPAHSAEGADSVAPNSVARASSVVSGATPLASPEAATAPSPARAEAHSAPLPAAAEAPAKPTPALNVEASAKESLGSVGALPPLPASSTSSGPAARVPVAPIPAPRALSAAPAPARPAPPFAPVPRTPPAVPAPTPRQPRPFDETLATQQFEAAVARASSCSEAGPTRGVGRVKVAIEPWGRVERVTHLNQDFTGTSVGSCVTRAFQQIQLPPFDGNSRSIAGEFVIQ